MVLLLELLEVVGVVFLLELLEVLGLETPFLVILVIVTDVTI